MCRRDVLGALLAASMVGCSSVDVSTDYDPQVDFSTLRTWAWDPEGPEGTRPGQSPAQWSPLSHQRAQSAVESLLSAKGYAKTTPEQAQLLVSVHFSVEQRLDYSMLQVDWGTRYPWGSYSDGYWGGPIPYSEWVMILDVLEAKPAKRLVWRGIAEGPAHSGLTPQERISRIRDTVRKILSDFPPGKNP